MGAGLCAPEHGGPETPRADGSAHPGRASSETVWSLRPRLAATESSMTASENFIVVEAAQRHDADEGYPWRWEIIYGEAHRTGACQTRVQAEREAAIVLALLRAAGQRSRDLA